MGPTRHTGSTIPKGVKSRFVDTFIEMSTPLVFGGCQNDQMRNSKLYQCQMFHVTCHFLLLSRMLSRLVDIHHPTEQGPLLWTERGRVSRAQTLKLNAAKMRRNSTSFSCLRFSNSELFRNFAECVLPCSTINNQSAWTDPSYVGTFHKVHISFSLFVTQQRSAVFPALILFVFSEHKYAALFSPTSVHCKVQSRSDARPPRTNQ